jgi:PAS domain S-box-containing protein
MNLDRYLQDCSALHAGAAGRAWLCRLLRPTLGKKLGLVFCAVAALVVGQHVHVDRYFAASRGIAAQVDAIGSLRWSSQRLLLDALEQQPAAAAALLENMAATLAALEAGGALRGAKVPPLAEEARDDLAELKAVQARLTFALNDFQFGQAGFAQARAAAGRLLQLADSLNARLALRQQALEGAERSRLWLISLLVASLLLALFVVVRLRVVLPLRALAAVSRDFAAGRRAQRSGFRSLDEIGQLSHAFDNMADTIEGDLAQLAASAAELETRQQALRKFSLAIEHGPISVVITDAGGTIEYVNPKFSEITGYAPEEAIGRKPSILKSGLTPKDVFAEMWRLLRDGREWHGELLNRKKNGELFWEDTSIAPLTDEHGRITHFVAAKEDITARKRAEAAMTDHNAELEQRVAARTRQLTESNRELEAFSYSISHDLRAPLRGINGFASLMAENCAGCAKKESLDFMARIQRASVRMGSLIDDILDLSRVARMEIKVEQVDLSAMVRSILDDLAGAEPDRRVQSDVQEGLLASGDATLLQDALENLIGNAWKFTARRDRAFIGFGCTEEAGERVFCVHDNGAGFDMKYAGKLFGAFQRLHGPQEFEGNGIGLAMVRRIINLHGGRIWAEGAPEMGARFYFTLGAGTPADGHA